MHQNIGPVDLYVMKWKNWKIPGKMRAMVESRKNKLPIPNSHMVCSSAHIPTSPFPLTLISFSFSQESKSKQQWQKIA